MKTHEALRVFPALLLFYASAALTETTHIQVTLYEHPDLKPVTVESDYSYDFTWGNIGQVLSVRWINPGKLEMTAVIGDFSICIDTGGPPLAVRVREAGRTVITHVAGAQVILTQTGPRLSLKTEGSFFEIYYDVYDTIPGRKHFFEVYTLRLQHRKIPRDEDAIPAAGKDELPDFFIPAGRGVRVRISDKGLQIKLMEPKVPVKLKKPRENDPLRSGVVLEAAASP